MAVYTFSTKSTKPADKHVVDSVKKHCDKNNMNFSALVVSLLLEWEKTNVRQDQ